MVQVIYMTLSGHTQRLVDKLDPKYPKVELVSRSHNPYMADEPYLLIVPSYEPYIVEEIFDLVEVESNREKCIGLIGTGNRNFADMFCYTAKDISRDYNLPILGVLEFQGMPNDVDRINSILDTYTRTQSVQDFILKPEEIR